jgi:hypothetical protein
MALMPVVWKRKSKEREVRVLHSDSGTQTGVHVPQV